MSSIRKKTEDILALAESLIGHDNTKAAELSLRSIELAEQAADDEILLKAYSNYAYALNRLSDYPQSYTYAEKTKILAEKTHNDLYTAIARNIMGICSFKQGDFSSALVFYSLALKTFKQLEEIAWQVRVLNNYGLLLDSMNDYKKALDFYQQALLLAKEMGLPVNSLLSNIGVLYYKMDNYEKALEYYQQAYKYNVRENELFSLSINYINLGECYLKLKNYPLAEDFLQKSRELCEKIANQEGLSHTYEALGELMQATACPEKAELYLRQAIKIAEQIELSSVLPEFYAKYSSLCEAKGDYQTALQFYKKCSELQIFKCENKKLDEIKKIENGLLSDIMIKEAKLTAIVEHLPELIWAVDKKLHLLVFNGSFLSFHQENYGQNFVVGEFALKHLAGEEFSFWKDGYQHALAGNFFSTEKAYGEGKSIFEISFTPIIPGAGAVAGVAVVARNISFQKRQEDKLKELLEAANAANEAKNTFLANLSHEIRTPLNGITGCLELISHEPLSGNQQELLCIVQSSTKLLTDILNDLLDLSKIEAGKLQLEEKSFVFSEALKQWFRPYKVSAEAKGLVFKHKISSSLNRLFYGDPIRLNQLLGNLLSNAVKFTEKGYLEIEAVIIREDEEKVDILINVSDTGAGIESNLLDTIFDRFARIGNLAGGTGLGLAICKHLSEMMHGSLTVTSTPAKGSKFSFRFSLLKRSRENKYQLVFISEDLIARKIIAKLSENNNWKLLILHPSDEYDCDKIATDLLIYDVFPLTDKERDFLQTCLGKKLKLIGTSSSDEQAAFYKELNCPYLKKPYDLKTIQDVIADIKKEIL